jgi:hypothetical protein
MWNYIKIHSDNSPMAEILSQCSDKSNLRLVIYHLSENHVECATTPNADREYKLTSDVARAISRDAQNGAHAILAFDVRRGEVYLIDSTPELPVASAVLLCVVTELLNGCVQPRQSQCGRPEVRRDCPRFEAPRETPRAPELARRDASGRFVRKTESDEPWKTPPVVADTDPSVVMNRRFRLGRH